LFITINIFRYEAKNNQITYGTYIENEIKSSLNIIYKILTFKKINNQISINAKTGRWNEKNNQDQIVLKNN
tara:strand:+ start:986 stop:1198 length:213 start_codon:yes stop_codon:yes gene_type:complete